MSRLNGKYALVTGATSGIGLEIARQFIAEGAKVAVTGRSLSGLEKVKSEFGNSVLIFQNDAGSVDDQKKISSFLKDEWNRIDILVCNAANTTQLAIEDWTPEQFDSLIATNLKGPFFLIKELLPLFSNPSSIILIGSVSSMIGHRHSAAYGASKAGLMALTNGLSYELKGRGIRVNGISPGVIVTNGLSAMGLAPDVIEKLYEEFKSQIPIKKLGNTADIAKAAIYLASDESTYTIGQVLRIDGGLGKVAVD